MWDSVDIGTGKVAFSTNKQGFFRPDAGIRIAFVMLSEGTDK